MDDWKKAQDHIRSKYKLAVDQPECIGMLWRFPEAREIQRQYIRPVMALNYAHIEITSNVVRSDAMAAHEAMLHNARLAIGALCISEGYVVLRAVVPLEGVDVHVLDRSFEMVAHEASRLRERHNPKPAPAPYYE